MDCKIIVATHKPYWMPEDGMYVPVQVGAAGKKGFGYVRDDTGENISEKNKNFCELTGLFWAWKNMSADYLGLAHYRRHFSVRRFGDHKSRILTSNELQSLILKSEVILPKRRDYYIETNYSQYVHAHHPEDLDFTREILVEKYPMYVKAFDESMKQTSGHRFNMFIMKRNRFDDYCGWLFDVLFELEKRLDISAYSDYDARVYGFVSERLLDVWLMTNRISYDEIPYMFMERQNWLVKGGNFLKRKFTRK